MADPIKGSRSAANATEHSAVGALEKAFNELVVKYNALAAKLDSDEGVANDFVAEVGGASEVELRP